MVHHVYSSSENHMCFHMHAADYRQKYFRLSVKFKPCIRLVYRPAVCIAIVCFRVSYTQVGVVGWPTALMHSQRYAYAGASCPSNSKGTGATVS